MKNFRVFFIFILFLFFIQPAIADIIAHSSKNIKHYGIGVLNMPKNYKVYQFPYKEAKIIREVNYEGIKKSAIVNSIDMRKVSYVTYIPSANIALLTVEASNPDGWYNVYLNQETGETGWVYSNDNSAFYTYKSLFYTFGKKYGIRMFNDLASEKKKLYAKQSVNSQQLEQLSYPKHITFTVIRGNWLLATVSDMTKQAKVGWFNWRNDDGTLNMFPNFKEQI